MKRYLVLYAVVFLALAAVLALAARREARQGAPPVPSSWILGPEGYRAAWRVLEISGVPVERWTRPFDELAKGEGNVLIVAAPRGRRVGELEATALRSWVGAGNTLVWLTGMGDPETYGGRPGDVRRGVERVLTFEENLQWALDVDLRVLGLDGEATERYVHTALETEFTEGVGPLYLGRAHDLQIRGSGWVPIAGTLESISIRVKELDSGRIWLAPTPHLLDNAGLIQGDNLLFLRGLIRGGLGPEGTVLFDEYHHGYSPSPMASLISGPVFPGIVLHLVLLTLLWILARGLRFGPPIPLVRDERRPAIEYLHAMAQLVRRSGGTGHTAAKLRDGFRRDLERSLGIPAELSDSEALERLGRRARSAPRDLAPWLEAVREGRLRRPRHLVPLARALRRAERAWETGFERKGQS